MRRLRLSIVAAALVLLVGILGHELRIDVCLDAGGRWNYDRQVCER